MEIYEITQPGRPNKISEAGGIFGPGVAATAGSLFKSQQQAPANASLWQKAKTALATNPLTNTAALNKSQLMQQIQTNKQNAAVQQVAKNLMTAWMQTQSMLAKDVNRQVLDDNAYISAITDWFKKNVVPRGYNADEILADHSNDENQTFVGPLIVDVLHAISEAHHNNPPNENAIATEFAELVALTQQAVQQIKSAAPPPGTQQAKPKASSVQAAQAALQRAASLSPGQLAAIQKIVGPLPITRSNDPDTNNYLRALGFDVP